MRLKHFLSVLLTLLTLSVGQMWGAPYLQSFNVTTSDTQTTFSSANIASGSAGRVSWTSSSVSYSTSSSGQVNFAANSSMTISVASGYVITKIETSTSTGSSTYYGSLTSSTVTPTVASSKNYTFSNINASSITINNGSTLYRITSTGWIKVYYEAASSCDKKVTITKGSTANGTFDLDKSNGSYDNCDANFVVHVSNIVPASNAQYCNGINATGGNSNVTGPVDGVWTVTYTKGNNLSSTITPTYANKTAASISFENAGTPAPTTTGYYVDDTYELPSTNNYNCNGKTFVGWSTVEVDETDTKPSSNFYEPGEEVTLAASQTFFAVFANSAGSAKTYQFDITANDFNTTSYAANNNEKTTKAVNTSDATDKMDVKWTSNQVMKNSSNMQFQKNNGYIYNSTDLGTINSVTVTSSAGGYNQWYGTTSHPTSGTSLGSDKGFFTVKENNTATGTVSNIRVNFTKSSATYSAYSTSCCTPLGQINGSFFWSTLFEPLSPDKFRSHIPLCNHLFSSSHHRIPPHLIYTMYISRDFGFF